MKKFILSALFVALSVVGYSQITLLKEFENVYRFGFFGNDLFKIEFSGVYSFDGTTIKIYDSDLNLIKTISSPAGATDISDLHKNVFTNSGKYEYIVCKKVENKDYYYLYNEDGNLIFDFGAYFPLAIMDNKLFTYKILYDNNTYKYSYRVYKIAGTTDMPEHTQSQMLQPYPNPAAQRINIPYSITTAQNLEVYDAGGSLVDIVVLEPTNTLIQLPVSMYRQGMYFWKIGNDSGKFIVK